jgi:8-oxo-dGTP diphosphatase
MVAPDRVRNELAAPRISSPHNAPVREKEYCYPFARPAVSVDIVVFRESEQLEILLVKRKNDPYKGRWSFPGGFVEEDEKLLDAAKRELKEETGLTRIRLEQFHAFGDPGRDPRGHTISIAHFGTARRDALLRAGDDAADAGWFPADRPPRLAFDHAKVLRAALNARSERPAAANARPGRRTK